MRYIAHFKLRKPEAQFELHDLKEHLSKVAEGAQKIGSSIGFANLFYLAGLLHDMGKYTDEFQDYIKEAMKQMREGTHELWAAKHKGEVDHGKLGAMYLYQNHASASYYDRITIEVLAMVIAYHHGGLKDYLTYDCKSPLLKRIQVPFTETDKKGILLFESEMKQHKEMHCLFKEASREIKEYIGNTLKIINLKPGFALHLLIKFLYSAVIDMDRWDSIWFASERQFPELTLQTLLPEFQLQLEGKIKQFEGQVTYSDLEKRIQNLRHKISQYCYEFAKKASSIYTLTVPTGGGKTVSSLRYALEHARLWGKERIIYILPYTTIIEQNAKAVREILGCKKELLEHHSNVIVESGNEYEDGEYGLYTQRWNVPIIFTTMVRYLDTFFKNGTQDIQRLHQMSNAILIFDEIQALPIKCITLFNETANFLNKICNSTIVLCSATQPQLHKVQIPLSIGADAEMIPDLLEVFNEFKRVEVQDIRKQGGYSYGELTDLIVDKTESLSSMLLVLNTKECVKEMYQSIRDREVESLQLYYLTTELCSAHRKEVISKVKMALAKKQPVLCISTQLIEAGVDISFECVIRHLAGMDSIAQAAGRANRHGEDAYKEVFIINLKMEKLGSMIEMNLGEVHSEYLLNQYKKEPALFYGQDLLLPYCMERYYNAYFNDSEIKKRMDYPLKIEGSSTTIADMLKAKTGQKTAFKARYGRAFELELAYPFETAGKEFHVIDENTFSVLVPYGKGKEIIANLFAKNSWDEKYKNLDELQQYSVNIRESQKNRLADKKAFEEVSLGGKKSRGNESRIIVLKEAFYDEYMGIVEDGIFDYLEI